MTAPGPDLWKSPWWLVVGIAFACGGWVTGQIYADTRLDEKLTLKADKTTVEQMARDVAAVKTLLCRQYPNDSSCPPGAR